MPQPDPTRTPLSVALSPASARALAAHGPSADALLDAVLARIASGATPEQAPPILCTGLVDTSLLRRAQRAAAERGTHLADAIEQELAAHPLLLPPAPLARLLHVDLSTLTRALANSPDAPAPAALGSGSKPIYDAHAIRAWWPRRRRSGRPATNPPKKQP